MVLEWSPRGVNGVGMVYQGCEWCWNGLPEGVNGVGMNGVGIVY